MQKKLILMALVLTPVVSFAQVSTVQQFLVDILTFVNTTLIPFLFTLGFVFFLFNVVRYFIIKPDSDDDKEKAKRFALYSIAALVLAVMIWGIVNLFASNLFGTGNNNYVCPDWLERFRACDGISGSWPNYGPPGSITRPDGSVTRAPVPTPRPDRECLGYEEGRCITDISQFSPERREDFILNNPSLNDGISNPTILDRENPTIFTDLPEELRERCVRLNIADENCNENVREIDLVDGDDEFDSEFNDSPIEDSALALFIYGSEREILRHQSNTSLPLARNQVVQVDTTASCRDGLVQLQSAANNDPTSAAYALYRNASGQTRWANLTDNSTSRSITIDTDRVADIRNAGGEDLIIVHTHQKRSASGIPLTAHSPSISDYRTLCHNALLGTPRLVVDWTGVWVVNTTDATCPISSAEQDEFGIVVGTNALAHLPAGLRDTELVKLINSPVVPDSDVSYYQSLINDRLGEMSTVEIRSQARSLLLETDISLGRTGPASFCNEEF